MPDLLTHFSVAYLAKRAFAPRRNMLLFLIGATLPDIMAYPLYVLFGHFSLGLFPAVKDIPAFFLPFHSLFGFFLFAWSLALLFPQEDRQRIFGSLFGGGLLHFALDLTQAYYGENDYFLFPFSWKSIHLNLYDSESSLLAIPFLAAIIGVIVTVDFCRKRRMKSCPAPKVSVDDREKQ